MTAPRPLNLKKGALIGWQAINPGGEVPTETNVGTSWTYITDHNRSELDESVERIESSKRMANGRMRKYYVADKKTYSFSWTRLPGPKEYTVDGFWGADDIDAFYKRTPGSFHMLIKYNSAIDASKNAIADPRKVVVVMFSDYSRVLEKRGVVDLYSLNITLEEV